MPRRTPCSGTAWRWGSDSLDEPGIPVKMRMASEGCCGPDRAGGYGRSISITMTSPSDSLNR